MNYILELMVVNLTATKPSQCDPQLRLQLQLVCSWTSGNSFMLSHRKITPIIDWKFAEREFLIQNFEMCAPHVKRIRGKEMAMKDNSYYSNRFYCYESNNWTLNQVALAFSSLPYKQLSSRNKGNHDTPQARQPSPDRQRILDLLIMNWKL
jgi:hypothetical protein